MSALSPAGVPVRREDYHAASITYQSLFQLYSKLAGMTVRGKGGGGSVLEKISGAWGWDAG